MNWCLCQARGKDKTGLRRGRVCNSGSEGKKSWGCGCVDYQGIESTASFFLQEPLQVLETQRREAPEVQTTSL